MHFAAWRSFSGLSWELLNEFLRARVEFEMSTYRWCSLASSSTTVPGENTPWVTSRSNLRAHSRVSRVNSFFSVASASLDETLIYWGRFDILFVHNSLALLRFIFVTTKDLPKMGRTKISKRGLPNPKLNYTRIWQIHLQRSRKHWH